MTALSWSARLARAVRRAVGRDREARWNAEWADGAWDRLQALDELGHHAILAGYVARLAPQGALLDVGCGAGTFLELLRGGYARYVGVDFAEPIQRLAPKASASERAKARTRSKVAMPPGTRATSNSKVNPLVESSFMPSAVNAAASILQSV